MTDEPPTCPIDARRNAGFTVQLADSDDTSRIVAMIAVDSRMHIVTGRGVYVFTLADQTDPERSNPGIPHSQQRVLHIGADSPIVGRVLLTADRLFKKSMLGSGFDDARALSQAWALTRDLAALEKMTLELTERQDRAIAEELAKEQAPDSLHLPAVGSPELALDAYAQKVGHAVDGLEEISRLFYPTLSKKWVDALEALVVERFGPSHPFSQFIANARPLLLAMRELRNAVEHPGPLKSATCYDFKLLPDGRIRPPAVDLKLPGEPRRDELLCVLMTEYADACLGISEALFAHLCNVNVKAFGGLPVAVIQRPLEQCAPGQVRMSYACVINGELVPLG